MKAFIKMVIIFILPILLIGILFEILLRRIPNDYSYKNNYLNKNAAKIEVLFLGSSHTFYGINPIYISIPSFNAGYVSQSLDYDFEILKKFSNKLNKLHCIVMPIDYFSLYSKLGVGAEAWRIKNYNIYYNIHIANNIVDNSEVLSNKLNININRLLDFYYKKNQTITCSELGWGTNYNSKDKQNLIIAGKTAAKRHSVADDRYFNENIKILKSIIEFARSKNIYVILYTSPAYKTYVQNLNYNQLNRTVNAVTKLASFYGNVSYYNLLTNNTFTANDFYDADHLNEIGAKKLTKKIDSIILNRVSPPGSVLKK